MNCDWCDGGTEFEILLLNLNSHTCWVAAVVEGADSYSPLIMSRTQSHLPCTAPPCGGTTPRPSQPQLPRVSPVLFLGSSPSGWGPLLALVFVPGQATSLVHHVTLIDWLLSSFLGCWVQSSRMQTPALQMGCPGGLCDLALWEGTGDVHLWGAIAWPWGTPFQIRLARPALRHLSAVNQARLKD